MVVVLVDFAKGRRELVIIASKEVHIFQTPDIGIMPSSGAHFKEKERNGHSLWEAGNSALDLAGL